MYLKIPRWFYESGLNEAGHPTIDHVIAVKNICGNIEVHSRPYNILQRQMERIIEICRNHSIAFKISGETTYENHDTCTLKFWLEENQEVLENAT